MMEAKVNCIDTLMDIFIEIVVRVLDRSIDDSRQERVREDQACGWTSRQSTCWSYWSLAMANSMLIHNATPKFDNAANQGMFNG